MYRHEMENVTPETLTLSMIEEAYPSASPGWLANYRAAGIRMTDRPAAKLPFLRPEMLQRICDRINARR